MIHMNKKQAKAKLYLALMNTDEKDLSDSDLDLMQMLLKDPEIREILDKAFDKPQKV